jgi:transposase-like protein
MGRPKKYPDELMERAVRLGLEGERPIAHIAADLGMHPETLRKKVRQPEADSGARPELVSSSESGAPAPSSSSRSSSTSAGSTTPDWTARSATCRRRSSKLSTPTRNETITSTI